jgi:hypothetical protein
VALFGEDMTWKRSCVVEFTDSPELFKLRAVTVKLTVKLTGTRLLSASDHEILREPTPFFATPFFVTVTSPGALGGPTEIAVTDR